jgi:ABC transporter substrate binding protein/Transposase DDE domain group 1
MRRREFIAGLGGAAAWSLTAEAQERALPVIGFLSSDSPDQLADALTAFRQGLGETGYIEGRNVAIEYRWAAGQVELLPQLAADLVRRQVAVIVAGPSRPIVAAKASTSTIPIVFWTGVDPVRFGLTEALELCGPQDRGRALAPGRLMHGVRAAIPQTSPLAYAEFATIRERLIKIGARVIEHIARIRVQLPTSCPEGALCSAPSRLA